LSLFLSAHSFIGHLTLPSFPRPGFLFVSDRSISGPLHQNYNSPKKIFQNNKKARVADNTATRVLLILTFSHLKNCIGSTGVPFSCTSKCRCGAVLIPVSPTAPICCPAFTISPVRTSCRLRCWYRVSYPFP